MEDSGGGNKGGERGSDGRRQRGERGFGLELWGVQRPPIVPVIRREKEKAKTATTEEERGWGGRGGC